MRDLSASQIVLLEEDHGGHHGRDVFSRLARIQKLDEKGSD